MRFIWYLIKSAFSVLWLFIAGMMYASLFYGFFTIWGFDNPDGFLNLLFVGPLMIGFYTWILNKFLGFTCMRNPVVYWGFVLGITISIFISEINGELFTIFGTAPAFVAVFFCEMIITFFLIPQMEGLWETYNVTEVTFHDDDRLTYREWKEYGYTPGWWRKFIAQIVISLIITIIYSAAPDFMRWVIFIAQGGLTAALFVLNIKNYFFE